MLAQIKQSLYFPVASYFKFWAQIQLFFWQPRIFVVTGSSGKTTLLHLIESQLGNKARYSHHANSSFGVPFDILGLKRQTLSKLEWPLLFLKAPFLAFKKPFNQKLYIVEADCDRPHEGQFLGSLLKPEVTMWLDISRTHTLNFDKVAQAKNQKIEETIAYEFGYFAENTKVLCLVNGDDNQIKNQLGRIKAEVKQVNLSRLEDYIISEDGTSFKFDGQKYEFNCLLPEETFYAVALTVDLLSYLGLEIDPQFKNFELPPGRSSLFKGNKNTTLLDSSYNTNLSSASAILEMYQKYPADKKWAVLSDMTELGQEEQVEHEKLAEVILKVKLEKLILMGPRMIKYTYPKLKGSKIDLVTFEKPKEVLDYLENNLSGGETILFKGARFLEGVIEHLLLNKDDIKKLCRREQVWEKRRKDWGL